MKLSPFFTFYGGKFRAAPRYPAPVHDTIIEPFAGAAGYSVRHAARRVILVERDPAVAATWRYLISVSPADVRALPDLAPGQSVDDLSVSDEARLLIGWYCGRGSRHRARLNPSGSATTQRGCTGRGRRRASRGGAAVRARIAAQVESIRHWTLIEGDYTAAPDIRATWFIDPPYIGAGKHYRFGSRTLDYPALGGWCRLRRGQVMVCENVGADWLPFRPYINIKSSEARQGGKVSMEALYELPEPTG